MLIVMMAGRSLGGSTTPETATRAGSSGGGLELLGVLGLVRFEFGRGLLVLVFGSVLELFFGQSVARQCGRLRLRVFGLVRHALVSLLVGRHRRCLDLSQIVRCAPPAMTA